MHRSVSKGFTLFEILIVIILLGSVAVFLSHRMLSLKPSMSLEQAEVAVVSLIHYAQSLAFTKKVDTDLVFDSGESKLYVRQLVEAESSTVDIKRTLELSREIQISSDDDSNRLVLFYADGLCASGELNIALSKKSKIKVIRVSRWGVVERV